MTNSLYGKFILFTVGTMVISFVLGFLAVNTVYHQYLKPENDAKNIGIAESMATYIESEQPADLEQFLQTEADAGYKLYVINDLQEGDFYGEPFRLENLSEEAIHSVLSGKNYHGMRDFPNETFVTGFFSDELSNSVGVPFSYQGEDFALFLRPNIKLLFSEIHYLLAGLFVVMAAVSIVFMLYVARKMVMPLSQLITATKRVGKEEFEVQLPVGRGDEIGQLAKSFNTMAQQLQESDQIRKQFINDVSHDFQTPLQNIKGYASIIEEGDTTTEEQQKYGAVIQSETERLSRLTKQLLTLTSIDSVGDQLADERVRIDMQIRDVLAGYRWQVEEKDIALSAELNEVSIIGHAGFLEKIWENLVSNAIKYTPAHGRIDVTMELQDDMVEIRFADSGIGIEAEAIPHLFDRFYRVDSARHQDIGGTGLGLSIVDQVVRMHGGTITVESSVGKGSTMIVRLPVAGDNK